MYCSRRHPAASVPDRRLHTKAVLRVVAFLGLLVPVVTEGSRQRQPGQPGADDQPQHQLSTGTQEQASWSSVHLLLHPPRAIWWCPAVPGHLWVWVWAGDLGVGVQCISTDQDVGVQPAAGCEDHQLPTCAGSGPEIADQRTDVFSALTLWSASTPQIGADPTNCLYLWWQISWWCCRSLRITNLDYFIDFSWYALICAAIIHHPPIQQLLSCSHWEAISGICGWSAAFRQTAYAITVVDVV